MSNTAVHYVCREINEYDELDSQLSNLLKVLTVTKVGHFDEIYAYFDLKSSDFELVDWTKMKILVFVVLYNCQAYWMV